MPIFDSFLGGAELLSNFFGGGAGNEINTSQSGTSSTAQAVSEASERSGRQSNAAAATQQSFSDQFLRQLERTASTALGRTGSSQQALTQQLGRLNAPIKSNFDSGKYVRGAVDSARSVITRDLERGINATTMQTGGSVSGNSASALLAGKLRNEAGSALAGVRSDAMANAESLRQSDIQTQLQQRVGLASAAAGLTSTLDASTANLIANLKGGAIQSNSRENQTQQETGRTATLGQSDTVTSSRGRQSEPFNILEGIGNLFDGIDF